MRFIVTCYLFLLGFAVNAQFFEQQDDYPLTYFYIGGTYQANGLKNAFESAGTLESDKASGIMPTFAYEVYDENSWYKIDASLLLMAVFSAVNPEKYQGLSLREYNASPLATTYKYYFLNDKFFYAEGAWALGDLGIGPRLAFGWEGQGIVRIQGKKGGELQDAVGEGGLGLLSMGTGLNVLNPLGDPFHNSRLTFQADWFLNRKTDEKFWFGTASRVRLGVELSAVLARRFTVTTGYSFFNFKNAFETTAGYQDAKISTFKLGVGFNLIAK